VTGFLDDRPRPIRSLSRFLAFVLIVIMAVSGLTARLFYLQVVEGGRLATLATKNRTVLEPLAAPRGLIYDRRGQALVTNVATFVVKLRPADLPVDQRPAVVERLAALLGLEAADINATIDGNPGSTFDLVRIAGDVDAMEYMVRHAPAAVYDGQALTYGELNRRANRLAHALRWRGVGPERLVGICVERSLAMVTAALAVLKAGGALVALDPAYPVERLATWLARLDDEDDE
jgi:cell division protein FtsI/penicillin-binding protein 2